MSAEWWAGSWQVVVGVFEVVRALLAPGVVVVVLELPGRGEDGVPVAGPRYEARRDGRRRHLDGDVHRAADEGPELRQGEGVGVDGLADANGRHGAPPPPFYRGAVIPCTAVTGFRSPGGR